MKMNIVQRQDISCLNWSHSHSEFEKLGTVTRGWQVNSWMGSSLTVTLMDGLIMSSGRSVTTFGNQGCTLSQVLPTVHEFPECFNNEKSCIVTRRTLRAPTSITVFVSIFMFEVAVVFCCMFSSFSHRHQWCNWKKGDLCICPMVSDLFQTVMASSTEFNENWRVLPPMATTQKT